MAIIHSHTYKLLYYTLKNTKIATKQDEKNNQKYIFFQTLKDHLDLFLKYTHTHIIETNILRKTLPLFYL